MRSTLIAGVLALTALAPLRAEQEFAGAVWVGCAGAASIPGAWYCPPERWTWILAQPEFKYLHWQTTVDNPQAMENYGRAREMLAEAKAAGKHNTMQFWVNHDGYFNASFHSIPNMVFLLSVRMQVWAGIAEWIEFYGPENLDSVCLWEETAGTSNEHWDLGEPAEDWRNNRHSVVDGAWQSDAHPDNPWIIGRDPAKRDGPYMSSVRNHAAAIRAESGLDVMHPEAWSPQQWQRWRQYASRRFIGDVRAQFDEFCAREFGMQTITWSYTAMAGDKFCDVGYERDRGVDGAMVNCYGSDGWVYGMFRAMRTLFPGEEHEVHALIHNDRDLDTLRRQTALAWSAGMTSVGYFSGNNNRRWDAGLDDALTVLREFGKRPVLADPYPLLVICDDYYRPTHTLLPTRFDVVSSVDRYAIDESRYERVIDLTGGVAQGLWGE